MREMKDSGIEWIGEIPAAWKVEKGKYIFAQRNEKGNTMELVLLSPTQNFGVIPQSLYEEKTGMKPVKLNENADLSQMKTIHNGDYCISLRSFQGGFEYCRYEGVVSLAYQVFYPVIQVDSDYYKYLFKDSGFIERMNSYTMTLRDGKNISYDDFGNTYIPFPTLACQTRIANFLDSKCAKIDTLIADIQAEIDILEQYKKSVITEAVTKGLDPNVEMKDSGIEWVGKMPVHWKSMPNKYIMQKIKILNPIYKGEDILSLTINGVIIRDLNAGGKMPASFDGYQILYPGNLLMCLFDYDVTPRCIGLIQNSGLSSPAYSQFALKGENSANYYYYYYLMIDFTKELLHLAKNLRHSFTEDQLGIINTPVPPVNEQVEISNYLDSKCAEIDLAIADKRNQIETLSNYKKSLIYEYVTGKKEVPVANTNAVITVDPQAILLGGIVKRIGNNQHGRTQLQKLLYLCNTHLELNLNIQYYRYEHGPYDVHLNEYIRELVKNQWFNEKSQDKNCLLVSGKKWQEFEQNYPNPFGEKKKEISELFKQLKNLSTKQIERIATLYAAWNDFLLDGVTPSDDQIIQDVVTNWTENKANFKYSTWQESLNQMKQFGLIPKGIGLHTLPKPHKGGLNNE